MLTYTARMLRFFVPQFLSSIQYILFIGVLFVINSCVSTKTIDFQILKPGKIRLGSHYENIYLHCEFCNNENLVSHLDLNSQKEATTSLNFIFSLKENLQKSPAFQESNIQTISTFKLLNDLKDYKNRMTSVDLIIKLDSIYLKDSVINTANGVGDNYHQCLIYKFGCKVYEKKSLKILDHYLLQDTSFFPAGIFEYVGVGNDSLIRDILWNTGIKAGKDYAHYLAPYWEDISRDFNYGYNSTFKSAYELIQLNELDSALNKLQVFNSSQRRKRIRAKAYYDMAIIYELKDDFENAIKMGEASDTLICSKHTKELLDKLRIRKINKLAIDWQLN